MNSCLVPSTSCDLYTCKVWRCYVVGLRRRCIYRKIHSLTLTLGSRSQEFFPVFSTPCDLCTCKAWSKYIQLLRRRFYMKIDYLAFYLDLDPKVKVGVKVTQNVAQFPLHHVIYAPAKFEVQRFRRRCIYKKCDGRRDRWTTNRLWYEINKPFFSKETSLYQKQIWFKLNWN